MMDERRLVLVKGNKITIVAQDKNLGDAENFAKSRQELNTLAQIGAYGNSYTYESVAKYMPSPSLNIGNKKIFSILSNEDSRYLGDIRLEKLNDTSYQIGIVIVQNERGKGYGSDAIRTLSNYAFKNLGVDKIYLRVYKNNPRAISLYLRLGFIYEKTEDDGYVIEGINYMEDWLYISSPIE